MLIDRYLPTFDETYIYEASVNATPDALYAAVKETNLRDPVIDVLFELRELPATSRAAGAASRRCHPHRA